MGSVTVEGPAPIEYIQGLGKCGTLEQAIEDPNLLRDLAPWELENVGRIAITEGNSEFADHIVQYFFEQALGDPTDPTTYNRDCAKAYISLETLLENTQSE